MSQTQVYETLTFVHLHLPTCITLCTIRIRTGSVHVAEKVFGVTQKA